MAVVVGAFAAAAPAQAINDPRVPGNECSNFHSVAVGDPNPFGNGNPGIFQSPQVAPPVSLNNPGNSTGAKGQLRSNAIGTCHNS